MRRVSSTAALFAAAVAVAFTAACGGSGSDGSDGSGQNTNGGGNNAFTAYTECMQKNGVTVTMPSGGPRNRPSGGPSRGAFPSGMPRPSGSGFPGGGGPGGFPGGGTGLQKPDGVDDATWEKAQTACASLRPTGRGGPGGGSNSTAYQNCLEDHGVTTTDGRLDTTDDTVQKAVEACKVLAPQASATPAG